MSKTYLSLDIRDQSISGFLVKSGLKGNSIEGHVRVPVEAAEESENQLESPWHQAISVIVDQLDTNGAICLITVPPALISYRNLRIPFKENRKIRQVLPFEVEPLLPFPLDDVILDFQTAHQGATSDVIAAAVEKTKLQSILDALTAFRLKPQIIIPGGFPVALCLAAQKKEDSFVYIDIDESTSTIFAVVSGNVHLVRSIYMGAASEELKIQTLKTNIQRFLVAFDTIYPFEFQPAAAYFTGDGIAPDAVADTIARLLDISAEPVRAEETAGVNFQQKPGEDLPGRANNPLCLVGVDLLGIASLNFFQERFPFYRYWEEYKPDIIRTAVIGALVLIVGMYGLIFQVRRLNQQVNRVEQQIVSTFSSTFPDVSKIVDPLQQMRVKVRQAKGENMFAGNMDEEILNIEILNDLSRLIPSSVDVVITRFVRGGGSALISGHTNTFNAVDDIKGALSDSEYFNEITISSANMDKSANRVKFKIKLGIPETGDIS